MELTVSAIDTSPGRSILGFRLERRTGLSSLEICYAFIALSIHLGAVLMNMVDAIGLPVMCSFRFFLGIPCPTCGSTRAICALDGGDLATAWAMNPMSTFAGILLLVFLCYLLVSVFTRKALVAGTAVRKWTLWLLMAGFLVAWVVRIIPL